MVPVNNGLDGVLRTIDFPLGLVMNSVVLAGVR